MSIDDSVETMKPLMLLVLYFIDKVSSEDFGLFLVLTNSKKSENSGFLWFRRRFISKY